MDILEILNFIKEYNIETREYRWELLLFIDYYLMEEFCVMVWEWYFDNEWDNVLMMYWCLCIDIIPILEYHEINIKQVIKTLKKIGHL